MSRAGPDMWSHFSELGAHFGEAGLNSDADPEP